MKITEVRLGRISVPLRVPFKTALRQVNSVEDIIVEVHTDTGAVGYGEAPPTGVITGDTTGAIIGALKDHIIKTVVGRDVDDFEDLMTAMNGCIVKNSSAKAAMDMALWDLYGQLRGSELLGAEPEGAAGVSESLRASQSPSSGTDRRFAGKSRGRGDGARRSQCRRAGL